MCAICSEKIGDLNVEDFANVTMVVSEEPLLLARSATGAREIRFEVKVV
jgi:hypothetical protein